MIILLVLVIIYQVIYTDVLPSPSHLAWHDYEVGVIIHFGMTTFAVDKAAQGFCDFNVGNFLPPPEMYNPNNLDTDQWMSAAKGLGAKYAVFVAQHCDGFSQWPTEAEVDGIKYTYSVKLSPWKNGTGDVVKDFVNSAKKYGIAPGVYYSLNYNYYANAFAGKPRDKKQNPGQLLLTQEQYDNLAVQQMIELWSNYGEMAEIWFDGSYTDSIKPGVVAAMEKYASKAVAFQGPSQTNGIRWVGNEGGYSPYPVWSRTDDNKQSGAGKPDGIYWAPPECDTIIRNRDWFWRPNHPSVGIKSLDTLINTYHSSTGTSCNLLLNMNPDWRGLIPEGDVIRYKELGDYVSKCYDTPIGKTSGKGKEILLDLPNDVEFDRVVIMEDIKYGENIRKFNIQLKINGKYEVILEKQSMGHKLIIRLNKIYTGRNLKLEVTENVGDIYVRDFSIYKCENTGGAINDHAPYPPSGVILEGGKLTTEDDYYNLVEIIKNKGLINAWFSTIVIEEPCFIGRDNNGKLIEDKTRWPKGLKSFGDYLKKNYITYGIHIGSGDKTKGGCIGSKGYEDSDVEQLTSYGATHIFVDWTEPDVSLEDSIMLKYKNAVNKYGEKTVLSFDNKGLRKITERGKQLANTWRTTPLTHTGTWESLLDVVDAQENITNVHIYSGPHFYNDLGPMKLSTLKESEQISQHMIWCMLDSPRFITGNINDIPRSVLENLSNTKLRDICNDKLALQAFFFAKTNDGEIYAKQLSNSDWIVLFFNRASTSMKMDFKFPNIGSMNTLKISNALTGDNIGTFTLIYSPDIPAHSSFIVRCSL